MPEFNAVENTLFIPMLGRIYASEHFQNILYDEKALSLKDVLPKSLAETGSQSQYTLLASASRSAVVFFGSSGKDLSVILPPA